MNLREYFDKQKQKKIYAWIITITMPILTFFLLVIVVYGSLNGIFNIGQSTDQNAKAEILGETGKNYLFSTLCKDCSEEDGTGVMGSDYYQKLSEAMNLYNNLTEGEEREEDFDFPLIAMTISYGKTFLPELFQKVENFGIKSDSELTNKDVDSLRGTSDITKKNSQSFFQWAYVMLGTPYSVPDLNLRGLLGNLIGGKVLTWCHAIDANSVGKDGLVSYLIEKIDAVERKFAGEEPEGESFLEGFWTLILSIFNMDYTTDKKVLLDKLTNVFENLDKDDQEYKDLKAIINLDDYFEGCQEGYVPGYQYIKFMNYAQYIQYLKDVFIPNNFINCEDCVYRTGPESYKVGVIDTILNDILLFTKDFRKYAGLSELDYSYTAFGNAITNSDYIYFTPPVAGSCAVTSAYGTRGNNGYFHTGIDIASIADTSLYAIADGTVKTVKIYTTQTLTYNDGAGTCLLNGSQDPTGPGIEIIIEHTGINGKTYYSVYKHVAEQGISVKEGDTVIKGQKIAKIGNTGCSTGNHLHFELYKGGLASTNRLDPTLLFKQCENWNMVEEETVIAETTENYVTPEKCMAGNYSLDEVITSIIKNLDSSATNLKEYVKATAIVLRTKIMNDTDWCNEKLTFVVNNLDIENNTKDLQLYSDVIETQGMVLTYSGELIDAVDYAFFPCDQLPTVWTSEPELSEVLNALHETYDGKDTASFKRINDKVIAWNEGCAKYENGGEGIYFSTNMGIYNGYNEDNNIVLNIKLSVPGSWIKNVEHHVLGRYYLVVGQFYASKGFNYRQILNAFYDTKLLPNESKIDLAKAEGTADILTSPGLIDAKKKILKTLGAE